MVNVILPPHWKGMRHVYNYQDQPKHFVFVSLRQMDQERTKFGENDGQQTQKLSQCFFFVEKSLNVFYFNYYLLRTIKTKKDLCMISYQKYISGFMTTQEEKTYIKYPNIYKLCELQLANSLYTQGCLSILSQRSAQ